MSRDLSRELQASFDAQGDPNGWFDALYRAADRDFSVIPWADQAPNPHLAALCERLGLPRAGSSAVVIGCGLGDDAEFLAARGAQVTAFDFSPEAIRWCHERWPASTVAYSVGDLLAMPGAYDLVVEIYTVQAMPLEVRAAAIAAVASMVAPGGELILICRGRDVDDLPRLRPWPLTRQDIYGLTAAGLTLRTFEDFDDPFEPGKRRFRVHASR